MTMLLIARVIVVVLLGYLLAWVFFTLRPSPPPRELGAWLHCRDADVTYTYRQSRGWLPTVPEPCERCKTNMWYAQQRRDLHGK